MYIELMYAKYELYHFGKLHKYLRRHGSAYHLYKSLLRPDNDVAIRRYILESEYVDSDTETWIYPLPDLTRWYLLKFLRWMRTMRPLPFFRLTAVDGSCAYDFPRPISLTIRFYADEPELITTSFVNNNNEVDGSIHFRREDESRGKFIRGVFAKYQGIVLR